MTKISHKIRWMLVALLSIILSWTAYTVFYNTRAEKEYKRFQEEFSLLEQKQSRFNQKLKIDISNHTIASLWKSENLQKSNYIIAIYKNESLIYWNSNQVDLKNRYSSSSGHFVGRFSNGYYLVDHFDVHDLHIYVGSEIKHQFYYENKSLQNVVSDYFKTPNKITIDWEQNKDNRPILSQDGNPLFYLTILKEKTIGAYEQLITFLLYLIGMMCLLVALSLFLRDWSAKFRVIIWLYPIFLLVLRYLSIQYEWIHLFNDFALFDPSLYANNLWIPNLGSLMLSLLVIGIVIWWALYFLRKMDYPQQINKILLLVFYLGLLLYSIFIHYIFQSLIVNSSIFLVIDEVSSLTLYSIIVLTLTASLFLSYFLLAKQIIEGIIQAKFQLNLIAIVWFVSGMILIGYIFVSKETYEGIFPVFINGVFFYLLSKGVKINALKYSLFFIILFSLYSAVILFENNQINEHQKRELYANQLVTDQDPAMEIEYTTTIENLTSNSEFYQLVKNSKYFSSSDFSFQLENCCFNGYWERYDLNFLLFDEKGTPLLNSDEFQNKEEINRLIRHHASASAIAKDLYFIHDYYHQLSYLGHCHLTLSDSSQVDFYILFKSKKIPEKIGFPRLLMNEKSNALQNIEAYSLARYSKGKLVMRYGEYNYPIILQAIPNVKTITSGFVNYKGFSHFIYQQEGGQAIIISRPAKSFIEKLSTFSYLILFFGVFVLVLLPFFYARQLYPFRSINLSVKVQSMLITMVISSFIVFGVVAIKNVQQQFSTNAEDNLKEKMYAIDKEINHEFRALGVDTLFSFSNIQNLNNYMKKLANTFSTDVNFYTNKGDLLATSQPKLYAKGINSTLMDNRAFYAMNYLKRSEFIHHELYGNLRFLSGYLPIENVNNEFIGYLNIQHFSRQNLFENQMNTFIVAVINLTVLILVITVIISIIVSGWITSPLRLIQQSFSHMELGKENKPINYKGDDEIGALVKEYNDKLKELELKALQLAQSERETAWREMAKQVAHEIKNPLTPMKLSIQQFQRSFNPGDDNAQERINRLVTSLIEQIDGLTHIANEFSNFAKMPKANEEDLDLLPILHNIQELYSSAEVHIDIQTDQQEKYVIFADKDLIIRVFNNLVKNAIQATKEHEVIDIQIKIKEEEEGYLIQIQDNGQGMTEEISSKVFTPNFTTKSTGSGLGLAMVKQIISNHNGEIWFETVWGQGTIFYIQLPKRK